MNNWISIKDEEPEKGTVVLTYWTDDVMETFYIDDEDSLQAGIDKPLGTSFITHWQHLPEPPQTEVSE